MSAAWWNGRQAGQLGATTGMSVVPALRPTGMLANQAGAALINTLLALVVLSAMMTILYDQMNELQNSLAIRTWRVKAEAAAESAVVQAGVKLLDDSAWKAGEDTTPEHMLRLTDVDARISTEHIRPPDIIKLTAVGRHRRGRSRVVRMAGLSDVTLFGLAARRRIALDWGATLDAHVTAADDVRIGRGVSVPFGSPTVSVICGREVSMNGYLPLVRAFESAAPMPEIPTLNLDEIKKTYGTSIANPVLTEMKLAGRSILREGSLTIIGGEFNDVSIFVAGDLRLVGEMKIVSKGDTPVFFVEKDLRANFSGAEMRGVIYVGGKATIRGPSSITGTIIAEEIDIADGVTVRSFERDTSRDRPAPSFFKRGIAISVP